MNALPVYRLITAEMLADMPSRLIVLYVRMRSNDDESASVRLDDLKLLLPSGEEGRVFDRPRAAELVRRTTLADVSFSYLQDPQHLPGGLSAFDQAQRSRLVLSSLFDNAMLSRSTPLEGYVVVDTQQPLPSLTDASIGITVHRLSDAAPLRADYIFPAPQMPTATPGPAGLVPPSAAATPPSAAGEAQTETAPVAPAATEAQAAPATVAPTPVELEPQPAPAAPARAEPTAQPPPPASPNEPPPGTAQPDVTPIPPAEMQ